MGISGRAIEKDLDLEYVKQVILEEFGRVIKISKRLNCTQQTVYDLLDEHPGLQEIRAKASHRYRDSTLEVAEGVLERILRLQDENIELAAKQAQFVLKNSDLSAYKDTAKSDSITQMTNPALLAAQAAQIKK